MSHVLGLTTALPVAAVPQKFTLINILLDGTNIWLPSSLMVEQGDEVELTIINKLNEPHGFEIAALGIEEVIPPQAQRTVTFTAGKTGIYNYRCPLYPPHVGGQLLVIHP
jgi:nitrosocyanin